MTDWTTFRELMPVTQALTYLNHAAVGPISQPVHSALVKMADTKLFGSAEINFQDIHDGYPRLRESLATLLNAQPDDIALTGSTSQGVSSILAALNWQEDSSRGLAINDLEFTSNSFAYQQIAKKFHVPIYVVKARKDENNCMFLDLNDYEELLEKHPLQIIGVSHVQFSNGYKSDLKKLALLAHKYHTLVLVDGIQSIGVENLDIKETNIDFLVAGAYKWCLGPFSIGMMYIKNELVQKMDPLVIGAFSDQNPFDFQHHDFHPSTKAQRMSAYGGPNLLTDAYNESISLINKFGIKNIENRTAELTDHFIEQIQDTIPSCEIESRRNSSEKSSIMRIKLPESVDLKTLPDLLMAKYKISVSIRSGGLRVSPHCYNTEEELNYLVYTIKKIL